MCGNISGQTAYFKRTDQRHQTVRYIVKWNNDESVFNLHFYRAHKKYYNPAINLSRLDFLKSTTAGSLILLKYPQHAR